MNSRVVVFVGIVLVLLALISYFLFRPVLINLLKDQTSVSISSANISVRDHGVGKPVVVIIHSMGGRKDNYLKLQKALSAHTRVISYDRPGLGYSSENTEARTLDVIEKDLNELLASMQVPPPYLLVGHSLGGHVIRYYADRHPDSVAGLVFLDTLHEDWNQYVKDSWSAKDQERPQKFWDVNNPRFTGVRREEKSAFEENSDMVRGLKIPKDIPVLIFTSGNSFNHFRRDEQLFEVDRKKWVDMQASLLDGVVNGKQIVDPDMTHWLQEDKPDYISDEIVKFFSIGDASKH